MVSVLKGINDFTEKSPVQPPRHQDTEFIKDRAYIVPFVPSGLIGILFS